MTIYTRNYKPQVSSPLNPHSTATDDSKIKKNTNSNQSQESPLRQPPHRQNTSNYNLRSKTKILESKTENSLNDRKRAVKFTIGNEQFIKDKEKFSEDKRNYVEKLGQRGPEEMKFIVEKVGYLIKEHGFESTIEYCPPPYLSEHDLESLPTDIKDLISEGKELVTRDEELISRKQELERMGQNIIITDFNKKN